MPWSDASRAKALATRRAKAAARKEVTANEIDLDMIPDRPRKGKRKQRRLNGQAVLMFRLGGKKYILPTVVARELYEVLQSLFGKE